MKKARKKIALMLVITLVLSFNVAYAATDAEIKAANQLFILDIYRGYSDGTLKLDNNINRAEITTLLIRTLGYEDKNIVPDKSKSFTDIRDNHWAKKNIEKAVALKLVTGYEDLTFKPENNISFSEVMALMVRAVYKGEVTGKWPYNYIDKAKELGIIENTDTTDPNQIVTRGQVALFIWKTLLVDIG